MQKSTPLSQLPSISASTQSMNNEPNALLADDDSTIQEVLNQINMQQGTNVPVMETPVPIQQQQSQQPITNASHQQQLLAQGLMHQAPPHAHMSGAASQMSAAQMNANFSYMDQGVPPSVDLTSMYQPPPSTHAMQQMSLGNNTIDMFIHMFANDAKLAVLVFGAVVAMHFIPAADIINKYVAIEKIPYYDIIVKALLCAAIVLFVGKILKI